MFSNLSRKTKAVRPSYQPSIGVLEDRIVPSAFWWFPQPPGPATHLAVEAPYSVKSGQPFYVEVEALDANNRLAKGYTGTVGITLGTPDSSATLPPNYTFTSADHDIHWFQVTLSAAGSQAIDAADVNTPTIDGSAATTVKAAPTATSFLVEAPKYALANGEFQITVIALDQYHHVFPGYTGTVEFTSSGSASLPGATAFSASNDGVQTFDVTLSSVGSQTITVTDQNTASITGTATVNVEAAGSVTHLGVYSFGPATVGNATSVTVVALDANGHVLAGFAGTVTFSDTGATLPSPYTFGPADDGRHTFSVTFNTTGSQTLSVTDDSDPANTGSDDIWVTGKQRWWGWGGWW